MNFADPSAVIEGLDASARLLLDSPLRHGSSVRVPARGRLLATGDLHDNPVHLRRLLRVAALERDPDRHVVLHELIHGERLIDGVDLSHRMLLRTAELVMQHPGQVHPLLANHEIAQVTGRGVSKGAGNSVELFNDGLEYVFNDAWSDVAEAIGRFVRAMPLALRSEPDAVGGSVFCAHSLPGPATLPFMDLDVLDRPLTDEDFLGPSGAAYLMTWGRGLTPEHLDRLAAEWGVTLFCLGHQHAETGVELVSPRTLVLNSDHERGAVVPIDLSAIPSAEAAFYDALPLSSVADSEPTR